MNRTITVTIQHPDGRTGPLQGFRFFWGFRVSGFRADRHCRPCLRGSVVPDLNTSTVRSGRSVAVTLRPQHRYLYICGVGSGPKSRLHLMNFHLPVRYEPGSAVAESTYNGYLVTVADAVALPIPELPAGWNGLDLQTTRCKNFRFGVAYFGTGSD